MDMQLNTYSQLNIIILLLFINSYILWKILEKLHDLHSAINKKYEN